MEGWLTILFDMRCQQPTVERPVNALVLESKVYRLRCAGALTEKMA